MTVVCIKNLYHYKKNNIYEIFYPPNSTNIMEFYKEYFISIKEFRKSKLIKLFQ